MLVFLMLLSQLAGYKYAAYYYWHSFRYVIPTDNSVTLQTIYSFTRTNNTFVFLKLFREFFYKNGSEFSQDLFFSSKTYVFCNLAANFRTAQ